VLQAAAGALDVVCPAVYPAPAGCSGDLRAAVSAVGGSIIGVSYLVLAVASILLLRSRTGNGHALTRVARSAGLILGVASVVFPSAATLSGGFGVGVPAIGLALVGLVACVVLTRVVVRRELGLIAEMRHARGEASGGPV
jgi:hypothetical protein